jgi:prophage tail gpP-like protein
MSGDEVSIVIGDRRLIGWETVQISRSAEAVPNGFVLTASEEFPNDPTRIAAMPGSPVKVMIGDDLVLTGYVDRYSMRGDAHQHGVEITGRGLCQDLVDCSADLLNTAALKGGQISAGNVLELAQILCEAFGIQVKAPVADLGPKIPQFQIALGETAYEVIAKVAQYAGYLVYEDATGALVLDRVGTKPHASGFQQGVNIEAYSATLSFDQRYSDYTVVLYSVAQAAEISPTLNLSATVHDPNILNRYRPRIIVSQQTQSATETNVQAVAKSTANWELARRIGRSQEISLLCDSWRDSAGELWQPNRLALIDAPALKIEHRSWVIGSVVYRKDSSGTHADLLLMPADAFRPQPTALNIFDLELAHGQL